MHLGVRTLSLVLEFIYCILNSNGEQIQHTTALEVYSSFPETTCFPLSALTDDMRNCRENNNYCNSFDVLDLILIIV